MEYWSGTESSLHARPIKLRQIGTVVGNSSAAVAGIPVTQAVPATQPPPGIAPANPLVLTWQGPGNAKVGDMISLTLSTPSVQGLKSLGFLVGFDPSVLKASEVVEGDFLQLNKTIDQQKGQIAVDMSDGAPGTAGGGGLVTIVFEVIRAVPQSQITIGQVVPVGASGETLAFAAPKPYSIVVGQ
jgi:general secretion pathway protein D